MNANVSGLLRMAPRARWFGIRSVVAGHAAFQIKLRRFAVRAAVRRDESRSEVISWQHIQVTMAIETEAALLVARAAAHVTQVSVLSVTVQVVARMGINHRIALMATLAIQSAARGMAHRAIGVSLAARTAMTLHPEHVVIGGFQVFLRQVTGVAFHRHRARAVTLHAIGHAREVIDLFVKVRMAGAAFQLGHFEMPFVTKDRAVIGNGFEDKAVHRFAERHALVGNVV